MKKRLLSLLAAAAVAAALSGCQAADTGQEVQTRELAETVVSETSQVPETIAAVNTDNVNIIVDRENENLYYFFKDGETIDLSAIDNLDGIKSIKIMPLESDYIFDKIIDIEKGKNTDEINEIFISGGILNDVSFLKSFENLERISFNSCSIKNASAVGEMASVISFSATDCKIDNIDFLNNMGKLETIYFESTPVGCVPDLALDEKEDFYSISLYFINCGEIDISGLVGLEDYNGLIYKIDLSKSIVKDFSPLASVYINELDLSNTYGSDFNTMKELNVGTIWLEGNKIDDIGFLEDNTVHTLFLNDNNIIDWTPLLNVEGLAWCWTFDNPIIMPDNKEQFVNKGIQIADSNRYAYSN